MLLSDRMTHDEIFLWASRGNQDAGSFLKLITEAFHVWDDLIDKDKTVSDGDINRAFMTAFVLLPENKFYMGNVSHLHPVICNAITNWMAANDMEQGICSDDDLHIAFIIRSEYINLVIETARICGGHLWATEIAGEVRRVAHEEGYKSYRENLVIEKKLRNGE